MMVFTNNYHFPLIQFCIIKFKANESGIKI
jgi:hypothetical protein